MTAARVGISCPSRVIRSALALLVESSEGIHVVLETAGALQSFDRALKADPDLMVIDTREPGFDLRCLSQFQKVLPKVKVVLLTDRADENFQLDAIRAGAWGCVSADSPPEDVARALKVVHAGELWASHRVLTQLIGKYVRRRPGEEETSKNLSRREWEILALVASGCRNKEIAGRLCVSENTVKTHLNAIFRKLNVKSRLAASLYYFQQATERLVQPETINGSFRKVRSVHPRPKRGHERLVT